MGARGRAAAVSGRPLSRCLSKMQLFQPSFESCPFERELNMDIAAALKVCPTPSCPPRPGPRLGLLCHSLLPF